MATIERIAAKDIRYGGELAPVGELLDGQSAPIIVERLTAEDGSIYYDLVDGYHRLGSMIASGVKEITTIVPTTDEFRLCSEFGGPDDAMGESDWIDHIQSIAE